MFLFGLFQLFKVGNTIYKQRTYPIIHHLFPVSRKAAYKRLRDFEACSSLWEIVMYFYDGLNCILACQVVNENINNLDGVGFNRGVERLQQGEI